MHTLRLTPEDFQFYHSLKKAGGLDDVAPRELDQRAGVVVCFCGDCEQCDDLIEQQRRYCAEHRETPRVHILALNGGALRLAEDTPVYGGDGADGILLRDISAALVMKQIRTVVLYGHAPCGAAGQFGLIGPDVIGLLLRAKAHVREVVRAATPDAIVVAKFHIDWGDWKKSREKTKNTYFLKRRYAEPLLQQHYATA